MIKRIFDICVSLTLLLVTFPVILMVSFLIKYKLGGNVLFVQKRPGLKSKIFKIYKFRTLTDQRDVNGKLLPDKERMTVFGSFLRSTSLDELPGLFNVIKGDMSLVGPRPLLVEYLPLYNEKQARRHDVRPGITGWAQVNGRNAIGWEDKFKLDIWYVENQSFFLDIKILLLTVKKVFKRDGITAEDSATMHRFIGNKIGGEVDE